MLNKTVENIEYDEWVTLGIDNVMRNWSTEVLIGIDSKSTKKEWEVIGKAITIINGNVDLCRKIAQYVAIEAGINFVSLPPKSIVSRFAEVSKFTVEKPTLIYLEPGLWMHPNDNDEVLEVVQENIKSCINAFNAKKPVIFVTSTDQYESIDSSLRSAGIFDRRFVVKQNSESIAIAFLNKIRMPKIYGSSIIDALERVGKFLEYEYPDDRRQGLLAIALKRLAKREYRKIEFADLINFSINGTVESDSKQDDNLESFKNTCVHEAGHAVIAIIDSNGENIPDFVTSNTTHNYKGMMSESHEFMLDAVNHFTYQKARHKVRICLAGRAAEQLVFGAENVVLGASNSDLESVSKLCKDMFGKCGISNNMEESESAGSNLLVLVNEACFENNDIFDKYIRIFLEKQYRWVLNALQTHRGLLDRITQALITNKVLNQDDLKQILNEVENTKSSYSDIIKVEK